MENIVKAKIDMLTSRLATSNEKLTEKNIKRADYDKTLIGWVSQKIERDDGSYCWRIQTNGVAYDITPKMCNITSVGQRVRLYVPNHSYKDKYAEVIDNYCYTHPEKVVYDDNSDTLTETWKLNDNTIETKAYKLEIVNKNTPNEEVTAIHFPDSSVMSLEGFIIG